MDFLFPWKSRNIDFFYSYIGTTPHQKTSNMPFFQAVDWLFSLEKPCRFFGYNTIITDLLKKNLNVAVIIYQNTKIYEVFRNLLWQNRYLWVDNFSLQYFTHELTLLLVSEILDYLNKTIKDALSDKYWRWLKNACLLFYTVMTLQVKQSKKNQPTTVLSPNRIIHELLNSGKTLKLLSNTSSR